MDLATRSVNDSYSESLASVNASLNITNETILADNPFSDPVDSETFYETSTHMDNLIYFYAFFEILKLLVGLSTFICDVYLIVIMAKFKKLRTRINMFILIFVILNVTYLCLVNLIMIIIELSWHGYNMNVYCIISNLDHLALTLSFYCLTLLALDWYFMHFHPDLYGKYPRLFKYGLASVFIVLAVPKWVATSVMCFDSRWKFYTLRYSLEGVSYTFCGITLIVIALLKRFRQPALEIYKTQYAFKIPASAFLMAFPAYIIRVLTIIVDDDKAPGLALRYLYLLEYVADCLFLAQPILILYLLGDLNKYFKMAYLKCCKKNVQTYDDDDLDTGSINETVTVIADNNVTFDRDTEVIKF